MRDALGRVVPDKWRDPDDLIVRHMRGVPPDHAAAVAPISNGETANYWRAKLEVSKVLGDPEYVNTGLRRAVRLSIALDWIEAYQPVNRKPQCCSRS